MKKCIVLPTYQEKENIRDIVRRILDQHIPDLEIRIVDDHSPDGTMGRARELEREYPGRVSAMFNKSEKSLSASVITGFDASDAELLLCMDADGQHQPCDLPKLFGALENGADFVIGSRYAEGGGFTEKWNAFRVLTSRTAAWMARFFLGVRVLDPMSGFFAIRREAYRKIRKALSPRGFKIMLEMLYLQTLRTDRAVRIQEVGIVFAMRTKGESKLSGKVIFQYLKMLRACRTNRNRLRALVSGTDV